ncbi:MAG: hypothetical protein KDI50_05190 [Candidatus Competibacteraceae bacterium]|nr:hypothetical protein [Candidatus Competibacteraceae bacterium]
MPYDEVLNALQHQGCQPKKSGAGHVAFCPVHESDNRDHRPSLNLAPGDKQAVVITCHAGCAYADIIKALGLDTVQPPQRDQKRIVATYSYRDANGNEVSQKIRYEPKDFRQRYPDGKTGWLWKKPKDAPAVLYRLPELSEAKAQGKTVYFVEGEKDADRLRDLGLVATCNIEGASQANQKPKWNRAYTEQLSGCARLVIIPDNDKPGKAHMQHIAGQLQGKVSDLRYLELPDLPEKGDVSDWLNASHTVEELQALAEQASSPPATQTDSSESTQETDDSGPARPAKIRILAGGLPEATDQAEAALIQHGAGIYQRSGYLCRISHQQAATVRGITRPQGAITITPLDRDATLDKLNRLVHWQKWNEKAHGFKRCHAPAAIAMTLLSRSGHWNFPPLIGVVSAPTLRPDGSILDKPGYDKATGLFLDIAESGFPPLPANPSRDQGQAALQFLKDELFNRPCLNSERPEDRGFSFASDSDQSAALAALLTALVRPSLPTAPIFLMKATRPGSAKTLLADIAALVATGRPGTVFELGNDVDEVEKRMLSVLLAGDSVVNLDNLEVPLAGATLCKALSGETITGRLLGFNKTATVPTAALFLATGNNTQVIGDMTRRVVVCNLDPQSESPEKREYDRNLTTWIPENRPALVTAGLTVLRAYIAAGQPRQDYPLMGSFEDWDRMIRRPLTWLGEADPLQGTAQLEESDPVRRKLRALLLAWFTTFGRAGATSKEAVTRAQGTLDNPAEPVLFEVLEEHFTDKQGKINPRVLGDFFKRYANRVEIGARFEESGSYQNRQIWRVNIVNDDRFQKFLARWKQTHQTHQTNKTLPDDINPFGESGESRESHSLYKKIFGGNVEIV